MPTRGSRSDSRDDTASSPREQRRRDAASKAAAGGRGRSGKSASSQPLELQIREFPSSCVFLNKEYTVKVFAMDARKTLHRHPVPLELVLFYANGLEVPRGEVARVSPFRMSDETGMCAEVKLTFFTPSLNFKNEKVYFIVRPEGSGGGGSGSSSPADASASASAATAKRSGGSTPILKPVTSSSVLVVRRRLVVLNKLPEKWFKDQGGRDKHMTVTVEMRDGDDQPVCPSTPVPLRVQVGYENSEELADSRILLLMGDPVQTPEIGSDGRAEVRFRIQEVSSGHRRQRFCLVVEPDIEAAPLNADIAGARSSAVDVRSKVPNKVKRKNSAVSSSSGGGGGGGGGTMSPMGTRSPLDATDGLHGGQYSPGGSVDVADAKRPRHHHHRTGHPERPTLTGTGLGQTMRGALDVYPAGIGGELAGLGGGRTAEESWMLASIEVLRKIEWQMIGYGVDGTGNMNYAEKIYRCPSCYRCSEPHTDDCPLHIAILHYDRLFSGGGGGGGGGGSGGGGVSRGAHATGALAGGGGRAPVQRLISDGNAGLAALSRLPSIPNPYALFGGATKRGGVVAGIVGSGGGGGGGGGGGSGVGGVGGGASSGGDSRETWMPAQPDDGFRTLSSAVSPKRSSSSNNNNSNGRRNGSSGRSSGSSSSGSRGRTGGGSGSTGGGSSSANGGRGGLAAGAPVPSDAVVGRVVRDHSLGAPLMDDFGGTGAARVLRNTSITTFELQNVAPITVDIKPRGSSSSGPSGSAAGGPGPSGGSGPGSASASGGAGGTRGEGGKGGRHHHAQSRRHGAGSSSRRHDGGDDDARHQVVVDDDDVVGVGDDSGGPDSLGVGVGGAPAMSRAESIISLANLSNNL